MGVPVSFAVLRWMIRDTFLQSLASRIFWVMLLVSVLCIILCLSSSVDDGGLTVWFGTVAVRPDLSPADAIHFLQLLLAGGVADTTGLLLALVWTAGFLPAFLEPSAAAVLLAKPVPRWSLLLGKYLGVLVFVGFQAVVFVGGTWLALGWRTGTWDAGYLLAVPILLLHFAIFFSFSTFLAVVTRSTVACVLGSILFWLVTWGLNLGRLALVHYQQRYTLSRLARGSVEVSYWILPKPGDIGLLLTDALQTDRPLGPLLAIGSIPTLGGLSLALSIISSLLFAGAVLALAIYEFLSTDY
jgi:ABC-type transport system involved in multi-copper enzyme maturation permease subunit